MTKVAVVDIGTNSTRLLITDGTTDVVRQAVVTGLGRGAVETGRLGEAGLADTLAVLGEYRSVIEAEAVIAVGAVATAAARMATNTNAFLDAAEVALGVRPEVIDGAREAQLSYVGAIADLAGGDWTVVDIGGASTEIIDARNSVSMDLGSVRLTECYLQTRPVRPNDLLEAAEECRRVLAAVKSQAARLVGVAGTWTSLAAVEAALETYDPEMVHHSRLSRAAVGTWVDRLADLSVAETARLAGLDPARAPVILGGAMVAAAVMDHLGCDEALISESDLLDGMAARLLGDRFDPSNG